MIGAYTTGENTLARELIDRLEPGMLVLADRGFCGFPLWQRAAATGADLLWRAKSDMKPTPIETLDDGSWLAEFRPSGNAGRHAEPLTIRVIEYKHRRRPRRSGPYRLFTTLLDPAEAPAAELAFAYAQRWEIELAFDELKTHQRGSKAVLRSKSPALVEQEIWGHLCCHYAIRTLMFEAAHDADVDPDRVSRSPPHFVSLDARSHRRAIFPPEATRAAGPTPSSSSAADSTRSDATVPIPD